MIRENRQSQRLASFRKNRIEQNALHRSLDKAQTDIAAGKYDVVTPATLREEFASVFGRSYAKSAKKQRD